VVSDTVRGAVRYGAGAVRSSHFVVAALKTLTNVALYLGSRGRTLLLEGRWSRGWYANWSGDRRHRARWVTPATEQEVVEVVRGAGSVRVVGAGHSFNDGLATTGTTMSLDLLTGVVEIDRAARRVTVRAGTRLRDLTPRLLAEGLALRSLASHDAQSVAGVLSTDDVTPGDDLFRAAVGGIGSVGVITRVTLQCVDAFDLRQATIVETRGWAEENLDRLLADHDHLSFYVYPFTPLLHAHTWDRTGAPRSPLGGTREALNEAKAAVSVATFGDAMAHLGRLPATADAGMRMQAATNLVLHSHEAFSRSQYHLHQELELAVPRDRAWTCVGELVDLYERMYHERPLPFLLVEVRFSPAGHECSLLGAGVERASAWLCLCLNQSGRVGDYFAAVEEWVRANDARVHLGKWCETLDAADLARMHGERFERFRAVRAAADPDGRFVNPFVERVLGPIGDR
jgi:FAD/FMN-containing dehydrogenase